MAKTFFTGLMTLAFVAAETGSAKAQMFDNGTLSIVDPGGFMVGAGAGVVLALGFQIFLTILSVSLGIYLFGNLEERFLPRSGKKVPLSALSMSSGFGLWFMITTSLSLFFATLLAVKITPGVSHHTGLTLGLVIWAAFFIILTYVELRSASSMIGRMLSVIFSGLRLSDKTFSDIFDPFQLEPADSEATTPTLSWPDRLIKTVKEYVHGQRSSIEWSKARNDLMNVLKDFEDRDIQDQRQAFLRLAQDHVQFTQDDIRRFGEIYDEIAEAKARTGGAGKVLNALEMLSPSDDDSREVRVKFENYLRTAEGEALNPDSLQEDLNKIVNDSASNKQKVLNRIQQFDHPTIVSIVAKKKMSKEQANQVVNRVEKILEGIKEKASSAGEKVQSIAQTKSRTKKNTTIVFEEKVRSYFSALQRPALDFKKIKSDFENIFDDAQASGEIMSVRLKAYDRTSLRALVGSPSNLSKEDVQRVVDTIEEARDESLRRAQEIDEKVKLKSQEAGGIAIHRAEQVRQGVMVSAWWLLATSALSACASVLGGLLALT